MNRAVIAESIQNWLSASLAVPLHLASSYQYYLESTILVLVASIERLLYKITHKFIVDKR